jgi:hypothetical protein
MANQNMAAVTPDNVNTLFTNLGFTSYLLYIGVTGDVALTAGYDTTATVLKAVPVGWLPSPVGLPWTQVFSTGTTASDIVALRVSVPLLAVQAP